MIRFLIGLLFLTIAIFATFVEPVYHPVTTMQFLQITMWDVGLLTWIGLIRWRKDI